MLKVARSSSSSVIGNDGIKSENKELQVIIEIVNTSRAPRYSCSSLNHHLLLVLSALGVPTDLFQRHLRNQTQQLSTMATTRHGIVQYFRSTESYRSSSSCEEVESDKTRQMILSMVFAGHEMKDPYLQAPYHQLPPPSLSRSLFTFIFFLFILYVLIFLLLLLHLLLFSLYYHPPTFSFVSIL